MALKFNHLSFLFIVLFMWFNKRTQNLYDRLVWRHLNYFSLLFSYLEREVAGFNQIKPILFKHFMHFVYVNYFWGFFRDLDIAVKISLVNTELLSATPFILVNLYHVVTEIINLNSNIFLGQSTLYSQSTSCFICHQLVT